MKELWYQNFELVRSKIAFSRQIESLILAEIEKGVRPTKLRMPGIRALADSLMKHNKIPNMFHAVEFAYKNLCKAGVLYTKGNLGTFISPDSFPNEGNKASSKQAAGFSFNPLKVPEQSFITIGPNYPDKGFFDLPKLSLLNEEVHQSANQGLQTIKSGPYQYLHPALYREVRRRALDIRPSQLAIIPGAGIALKIVLQSLLKKEEKVILSAKCSVRVKELIRMTGAEIIEIGSDQQGIIMSEIVIHCKATAIKLIYVEPAAQHPDTVHLTAKRRIRLLQLSEYYQFAIIEHNEEHGCYYGSPAKSLFDKDKNGRVIYISSLSRHAPWLQQIGFVLAPENFIDHLAAKSLYLYETWDINFERALVRLIEKGSFHNLSRKVNAALTSIRKKASQLFHSMQLHQYGIMSNTKAGIFVFIHFMIDISTLIPKLIDSGFYDPPDRNSIPHHQITGLRISLYFGSQTRFSNLFKILKAHFMNP